MSGLRLLADRAVDAETIGGRAVDCLKLEVATWPKPGLVSHRDKGSHRDMDAALLDSSADALGPWFSELARAGAAGAGMDQLRSIGLEAEAAMRAVTAGVNTHRGAIFGLGLLCAAEGYREACAESGSLGQIVTARWRAGILGSTPPKGTHGGGALRRYGAGGARAEAADGFPSVYDHALPALALARTLAPHDAEAWRVQACMALIAVVEDTNLLHRGGWEGLMFAQDQAARFLAAGGVADPDWRARAAAIHAAFVRRRLSPGGCADLLAMALFVQGAP